VADIVEPPVFPPELDDDIEPELVPPSPPAPAAPFVEEEVARFEHPATHPRTHAETNSGWAKRKGLTRGAEWLRFDEEV
jgi:hypothetical protein